MSAVIFNCLLNVICRSSLNVIDRFLFGGRVLGFFYVQFLSLFLPFLISIGYLGLLHESKLLFNWFTSFPCFFLSISAHLVGLSYSYAFRHHQVKHVIIRSKLPELILPIILFIPFFYTKFPPNFKTLIPLAITWTGILPIYFIDRKRENLLDKTTLFIAGSSLLQMFFSSYLSVSTLNYSNKIGFTTAMLLWRCLFTLPFCFRIKASAKGNLDSASIAIILFRAVASFATQVTFTWCVFEGNPLVVWPLLSLTPIVATVGSHILLKEKIKPLDLIPLVALFLGSTIALII